MATLKLKTAPTVEPITRDEAKAHCRIDGAEDDLIIDSLILAARNYVEGLCGPLINQTWYQYDQNWPDGPVLEIYKPRMSTGTAPTVKYTDEDGLQTTLTASWYTARITEEYRSQIVLKSDYSWPSSILFNIDPIVTEFVCGYGATAASVPETIKIAMLMLVAHWYEERQPVAWTGTVQEVPMTVDALLASYRVWDRG